MNLFVTTKMPLDDMFTSLELFYRFGTIYRTFIIKITYDACNVVSGAIVGNKLLEMVLKAYAERYLEFFKPCSSSVNAFFFEYFNLNSLSSYFL